MTHREMMVAWLDDPDPDRQTHARGVLAALDGADPDPLGSLVARARRCPHWSPGRSCCDGWLCVLYPDEPRVVSIQADCRTCPELPPPA